MIIIATIKRMDALDIIAPPLIGRVFIGSEEEVERLAKDD